MQTVKYVIGEPEFAVPLFLWRAIPTQLTIRGVEDTSGDWIFFVDSDRVDGAVLTGSVTAEGENLTVTLADMNTAELAGAIKGRDTLPCRATLTDGTSRIYSIPLTILNRALGETPTPAPEYYTKARIDEIIAGLQPGAEIVTLDGPEITFAPKKVFRHTLAAGEVFTFDTSGLSAGRQIACEVHFIQPSTAVSFTLPSGILWEADGVFSAENDPPDFSAGGMLYAVVFRWTGSAILGNLAYAEAL